MTDKIPLTRDEIKNYDINVTRPIYVKNIFDDVGQELHSSLENIILKTGDEWKRRLTDSIKDLEQVKKERDNIKDEENIPDNFKKDLTKFMDQFVVAQEKTIKKLKKKVK